MSFWDNVKKFAQPYADDEYDDYEDEELDVFEEDELEEAPRGRRRSNPFAASEPAMDYNAPMATPVGAPMAAPAMAAPAMAPMAAPAAAPAASAAPAHSGFSGRVVSMGASGNKQEVVLFHAKSFDDAAKATDELRNRRAIILNMENVDKALTRRVVDFLSGSIYALDGKVKKIAQSTYLFCPYSMDIVGDLESFQAEAESYI